MEDTGREMGLDVEAVPIDRFIPIPHNENKRNLYIGRFGKIDVYVFDPYAISLSKIDRGFDTDLDDVVFLIKHEYVDIEELEQVINNALPQAHKFDMDPNEVLAHFQVLKDRLSPDSAA